MCFFFFQPQRSEIEDDKEETGSHARALCHPAYRKHFFFLFHPSFIRIIANSRYLAFSERNDWELKTTRETGSHAWTLYRPVPRKTLFFFNQSCIQINENWRYSVFFFHKVTIENWRRRWRNMKPHANTSPLCAQKPLFSFNQSLIRIRANLGYLFFCFFFLSTKRRSGIEDTCASALNYRERSDFSSSWRTTLLSFLFSSRLRDLGREKSLLKLRDYEDFFLNYSY